ncbi:hypothetical protein DEDE109153_09850 [Deinococcus deserti]|uniref:hypothetical protein n=1 Tax=Deinococcus deserti TaxID=310783 RepID=UPI0002FFA1FC|nr:hypothetical protein [Deinococcus deserti]
MVGTGQSAAAGLNAGQTTYWLSPARLAEQRLPPELLARYARLTAGIDELHPAYAEAVKWTVELAGQLELALNPAVTAELRGAARTSLRSAFDPGNKRGTGLCFRVRCP